MEVRCCCDAKDCGCGFVHSTVVHGQRIRCDAASPSVLYVAVVVFRAYEADSLVVGRILVHLGVCVHS